MTSKKLISALFFSLALGFLFFSGCTQTAQPANATTLQYGNKALVDYILVVGIKNTTANSTQRVVYDTSLEQVARSAGIYNSKRVYQPLVVDMQLNSNLLQGFTRALVGMREGENKTFTLEPQEAYGLYNYSKAFTLDSEYNKSRFETIPSGYLTYRNFSTAVGTNLSVDFGTVQIVNSTNDSVTLEYFPENNSIFVSNDVAIANLGRVIMPQQIIGFDNDTMTIGLMAVEGSKYVVETLTGSNITVRATSVNGTAIVLDANNQLAGKQLEFTVFVKKIE